MTMRPAGSKIKHLNVTKRKYLEEGALFICMLFSNMDTRVKWDANSFQGQEQLGRFLHESDVINGTAASGFNRSHFRKSNNACRHGSRLCLSGSNTWLDGFRHGKCVVSKEALEKYVILVNPKSCLHANGAVRHTRMWTCIKQTRKQVLQDMTCQLCPQCFMHHYAVFEIYVLQSLAISMSFLMV